MYIVGVTLRWLKYLRYAPEVENDGMLPTRPLSTLLFLMYTLDILYSHHRFPFAIRTTEAQLERKKDVQTQHKYRDSSPRRKGVNATGANAKLVS